MNTSNGVLGSFYHDASDFYVSRTQESGGHALTLRLRCSVADVRLEKVRIRTLVDGEPSFSEALPDDRQQSLFAGQWWSVTVHVTTHSFKYRWLLSFENGEHYWLNGDGLWNRSVPDYADFNVQVRGLAPEWHSQSSVYQIFPDRFARSTQTEERGLPVWSSGWLRDDVTQWKDDGQQDKLYGGDLWGVIDRLDYIHDLGFDTIYLTPFFEARSSHRYDATSFKQVDPYLGGDKALVVLAEECHRRGMHLIGDLTANHTGVTHEWFRKAQADPQSVERGFYFFDPEGNYATWLGVPTLPKLNYSSDELRQRMFGEQGVVQKYLKPPFNLDGWRIDVAHMTGRHGDDDFYSQVAQDIRHAVDQVGGKVLIAEHCHDFSRDIDGHNYHGSMNYTGFTRPIWEWFITEKSAPVFMGSPVEVSRLPGQAFVDTTEAFSAQIPWSVRTASFNLIASHDTVRVSDVVSSESQIPAAFTLCFTLPGVPMVLYGDELELRSTVEGNCRVPFPWANIGQETDLQRIIALLAQMRREYRAISHGGLRWVHISTDQLAFMREHRQQTVLVCVSRTSKDSVCIRDVFSRGTSPDVVPIGEVSVEGERITCTFDRGIAICVWDHAIR